MKLIDINEFHGIEGIYMDYSVYELESYVNKIMDDSESDLVEASLLSSMKCNAYSIWINVIAISLIQDESFNDDHSWVSIIVSGKSIAISFTSLRLAFEFVSKVTEVMEES